MARDRARANVRKQTEISESGPPELFPLIDDRFAGGAYPLSKLRLREAESVTHCPDATIVIRWDVSPT